MIDRMAQPMREHLREPFSPAGRCGTRPLALLAAGLLLCGLARVWVIRHTEAIAADGTIYVAMARQWASDPSGVIDHYDYHVGYPVLMSWTHGVLVAGGAEEGLASWELSGQIVSLIASLAAMAGLWMLVGKTLDWRTALATVVIFGLTRKWALLGADVLSDSAAACLQLWGVALAVVAAGEIATGRRRAVFLAGAVGVCVGAGYLFRPEGLFVAALAALLWLGWGVRRHRRWRLRLAACGVMLLTAAAVAAPYAAAIGGLTKKKKLGQVFLSGETCPIAPVQAGVGLSVDGAHKLFDQFTEALHPALTILAVIWLTAWIGRRWLNMRLPIRVTVCPRGPGAFAIAATLAVQTPLWIKFHDSVGYLSHRHVLLMAALTAPLAAAGVLIIADWFGFAVGWLTGWRRTAVWAYLAMAMTAGALSFHTLRPLHEGKGYLREAGLRLRSLASSGDLLATDNPRVRHYAGMNGPDLRGDARSGEDAMARASRDGQGLFIVVSGDTLFGGAGWRQWLIERGAMLVTEFSDGASSKDRVWVYRLDGQGPGTRGQGPVSGPAVSSPGP